VRGSWRGRLLLLSDEDEILGGGEGEGRSWVLGWLYEFKMAGPDMR